MPQRSTISLSIVDSVVFKIIRDWRKYIESLSTDNPLNNMGGMCQYYMLQILELPQSPSRVATDAELQSLDTLAVNVEDYHKQRNSPDWDSSISKNMTKKFYNMGVTSRSPAIIYLKEAFNVEVDKVAPAEKVESFPSFEQVQQTVENSPNYVLPPAEPKLTYTNFKIEQARGLAGQGDPGTGLPGGGIESGISDGGESEGPGEGV